MPRYPTRVSLRSDAAEAPTTRRDCRQSGLENADGRTFVPFSALAPAIAPPAPRVIADVREPPGVRTRRLPPHPWH